MATAKRSRIDARAELPKCRCPDCGAIHWRRKGGRVYRQDPARDRRIFKLYERGKTQAQLAKRFSLSRPRISTILLAQRARVLAER